MKKSSTALAILMVALFLGGCAVQPESRLDEFLEQSAALARETAEAAAAVDTPGTIEEEEPEARIGDTSSAEDKPSDPAWAQARAYVAYGEVPGASETAMTGVAEQLTADGWAQSRVREVDGQITEGFRREIDGDRWYIEIQWVEAGSVPNESIRVLVVSPSTTRGDTTVR
jgi:hypothetical protein